MVDNFPNYYTTNDAFTAKMRGKGTQEQKRQSTIFPIIIQSLFNYYVIKYAFIVKVRTKGIARTKVVDNFPNYYTTNNAFTAKTRRKGTQEQRQPMIFPIIIQFLFNYYTGNPCITR